GQLVLDSEYPIDLHVELPVAEAVKRSAELKDHLAFLLDTRFHPSPPQPSHLTIRQVALMLGCRCRTILRMVERGQLRAVEENGELYFERDEIESIRFVPINQQISKLVPRPSKADSHKF